MYLELIEKDNYKPLPGGIFNKGFVKAYAKYVGVDEQEALQDYARLITQNEESDEEFQPRYRPEVLTDDARSASSFLPTVIFAGIILALMTGGILFVVNYIKNQPDSPAVTPNTSSNNTANTVSNSDATETNTATDPVPDQIRIEFRVLAEKVSVTSTVDGNLAYDEITSDSPKTYTANEGIKLRYYRGFADRVQLVLNGTEIAAPPAPAKGNIEIEITKANVAQIIKSGQILPAETATDNPQPSASVAAAATATATATAVPTPVATSSTPIRTRPTPRPSATSPRPAFTPLASPRRSPTPIIAGRPPVTQPSPN